MLAGSYRRIRPIQKRVAIIIPMGLNPSLNEIEKISLRHLDHFIDKHDRFFIIPEGTRFEYKDYKSKKFPRKYFGSVAAHARMLYNAKFYHEFQEYEYLFFYHTDAIVLSPNLDYWLDKNYDYIGPPWITSEKTPWVTKPRVGNSGFALLKVESIERALRNRVLSKPHLYWSSIFVRNGKKLEKAMPFLRKLNRRFPNLILLRDMLHEWDRSETNKNNTDLFYSDRAKLYYPEFTVAPFEEGLRFGFEVEPQRCFEMNNRELPFGAHAWYKYDKAFWEPHLLTDASS